MSKIKDYSQNGEQEIILDILSDINGTFLSLGENDGKTLSNVRGLVENGWTKGVCVEPSEESFNNLKELYKNTEIHCFKLAVGTEVGELDFWDSGKHANFETTGLLSSLDSSQMDKWGSSTEFKKTTVKCVDFKTLLELSPYKKFDMVSIDCENMDYEILTQMDLGELSVKCLIIESNSIENEKYVSYCNNFGLFLVNKNRENLIFKLKC